MRQIDAKSSKFRIIGAILTISKSTIGLFGIVMWAIALYGWHQLVFFRLFPSFWLFAIILASLYVVAAVINYTVIIPVEYRFIARQSWRHDNPIAAELKALRGEIESLKEMIQRER